MNINQKFRVLNTISVPFICENCSKRVKKVIHISFEVNLKTIRTYICEKCFKNLFKYINYEF